MLYVKALSIVLYTRVANVLLMCFSIVLLHSQKVQHIHCVKAVLEKGVLEKGVLENAFYTTDNASFYMVNVLCKSSTENAFYTTENALS
jgi:hypothetical protein